VDIKLLAERSASSIVSMVDVVVDLDVVGDYDFAIVYRQI
jgi:hypothetical protein